MTPGAFMACLDQGDPLVAWALILTVLSVFGFAPSGVRARWRASLTRRDP